MLQIAQFEKLLFCREVTFKGVCNFTFGYYKEKDELKGGSQKSVGRTLREGQAYSGVEDLPKFPSAIRDIPNFLKFPHQGKPC